jgi:hypothetical protein
MQNSDFLAVGCGLNDCSCIASDFAVLAIGQCEPIGIEEKAAVGL